ncbi:MAG: nucleotidyltransferase domain-containing protein [Thermomicrobiales bacterium]
MMTITSRVNTPCRTQILNRVPEPSGDSPRTREEIADVVAIIAETFRPERIILFGSHAYGDPTEDSDVDLMVVMDTPLKPSEQAVRIRQAVGASYRFPMDVVVRRPNQIALGLAERDFFILDVIEQGATLFETDDSGMGGEG